MSDGPVIANIRAILDLMEKAPVLPSKAELEAAARRDAVERPRIEARLKVKAEAMAKRAIGREFRIASEPSIGSKMNKLVTVGRIIECVPSIRWSGRSCHAIWAVKLECGANKVVRGPFNVRKIPV